MDGGFKNRRDAGRRLAAELIDYADRDPIVLGLPRGGVPVAFEIARRLNAPLDVVVSRKLGAPMQPELGIGAIAEGGVLIVDEYLIRELDVHREDLDRVIRSELSEMRRRLEEYRGGEGLPNVKHRTAILVDDGLATGVSMIAAVRAVRQGDPDRVVVAVPVCARETVRDVEAEADEVICTLTPEHFTAVGFWYENFDQTSDAEVIELLEESSGTVTLDDLDER